MALKASKTEKTFETPDPLEPGTYPARVVQILSLGLQKQKPFQGQEKPPADEIHVTYELVDEFLKDEEGEDIKDKPRWISETFPLYSLNSDLAKSTKRYVALDPELKHDGDWGMLAGYPCMVTVVKNQGKGEHKDKVFNNVASVQTMRAKEVEKCPELVNPPKIFDIDEPDLEVFKSLPQWLQDKMTKENLDFEGSALEKALQGYEGTPKGVDTQKESKAPERSSESLSEPIEAEGGEDW